MSVKLISVKAHNVELPWILSKEEHSAFVHTVVRKY